ncbi:hypothetical protein Aduo_018741 [Ancylostoma duodenale]
MEIRWPYDDPLPERILFHRHFTQLPESNDHSCYASRTCYFLVYCSLSLSVVSPRLSDPLEEIVIIPEYGTDATTPDAVANAVQYANIHHQIRTDPVDTVHSVFPLLRVDDERQPSTSSGGVVCLNL